MTADHRLVSVVVPAYRHETYVTEALESVYGQDYEAVELIVVDDRSPDGTAGAIRDYLNRGEVKDRFRRIVFLENARNLGAHRTINRGDPEMQMNYYNVSELMFIMQRAGVQRYHAEFSDHGGALGVFLFFHKPSVA